MSRIEATVNDHRAYGCVVGIPHGNFDKPVVLAELGARLLGPRGFWTFLDDVCRQQSILDCTPATPRHLRMRPLFSDRRGLDHARVVIIMNRRREKELFQRPHDRMEFKPVVRICGRRGKKDCSCAKQ